MRKLFMASIALTVFAVSITLFQMASCKKSHANDCPPVTYPVSGLWEGTYQTDQVAHATTYMSFAIYPDGSFLRKARVVGVPNEVAYFKGSWKLNGKDFTFRDTTFSYSGGYVITEGALEFNNEGTLSNGSWDAIVGQTYTGTFQNMKRINKQ